MEHAVLVAGKTTCFPFVILNSLHLFLSVSISKLYWKKLPFFFLKLDIISLQLNNILTAIYTIFLSLQVLGTKILFSREINISTFLRFCLVRYHSSWGLGFFFCFFCPYYAVSFLTNDIQALFLHYHLLSESLYACGCL